MKKKLLLVLGAVVVATASLFGQAGDIRRSLTNLINPLIVGSLKLTSSFSQPADVFLRRSGTKTLTIDTDGAGGALTTVNIMAPIVSTGGLFAAPGSGYTGTGQFSLYSTASKQSLLTDSAGLTGTEFNNGTPTLGACTGGSLTSGSHNIAGEVTGNTSGVCAINFGTPNFTNAPFCFANDETTLTAVRISARSTSSITVTGAVSGDAFQFFCVGRIGT